MKIMIVAPYIFDNNIFEFTRNKTGFGKMVREIMISVGKLEDVELLTRVIISSKEANRVNYNVLPHTWKMIIKNATIKDWGMGINKFFSTHGGVKNRLRQGFYAIDNGYAREQIKRQKPDIVHIHGLGSITKGYIEVCEKLGIKYALTLHGLIGLDESLLVPECEKRIEKEFLIFANKKNIPISVISSGIKERIEEKYLGGKADNITVIKNGTSHLKKKRMVFAKKNDITMEQYLVNYKKCLKENNSYPNIEEKYVYLK